MYCCQTTQPEWLRQALVVSLKLVLICRVYSFGPKIPPPPKDETPTLFSEVTPLKVEKVPCA